MLRRVPPPAQKPNVEIVIKSGAKVQIKQTGRVVLSERVGKLTVEDGADFEVAGTLEIEEPGDPTKRRRP